MMNRNQAIAYGRHIGVRYHIYNSKRHFEIIAKGKRYTIR